MNKYQEIGRKIGELVESKNRCYGDNFDAVPAMLQILYPDGVNIAQYGTLLAITRICDKLMRIATNNDPNGESPWQDIAGYAILMVVQEERGSS